MTISTDTDKEFDKTQHSFMVKLSKYIKRNIYQHNTGHIRQAHNDITLNKGRVTIIFSKVKK